MTWNQTPLWGEIVSCGYQGGTFAEAIARGGALDVTAFVDPDQAAARDACKEC